MERTDTIILHIQGQHLMCFNSDHRVSDTIGFPRLEAHFSAEWRGLNKWLHLKSPDNKIYDIELQDDKADGLNLTAGRWELWLHGAEITADVPTLRITTGKTAFFVEAYAGMGQGPLPELAPTVAEQVASNAAHAKREVEQLRKEMDCLDDVIADTIEERRLAQKAAQEAEGSHQAASHMADHAGQHSEEARQALSDLIATLGTDVASLVGGKIPIAQLPATATQEIYTITDEAQLNSLTAQRGDLAELIENVNGEQTIIKTWQCLGDASIRASWVVWGTSYAVQAGHSTFAHDAVNAATINGHRLVEMTREQFNLAVKDPDTYYLVYDPDMEAVQ